MNFPMPVDRIHMHVDRISLKQSNFKGGHRSGDSFTILGLWVLGLAVSNINESQLQTYES